MSLRDATRSWFIASAFVQEYKTKVCGVHCIRNMDCERNWLNGSEMDHTLRIGVVLRELNGSFHGRLGLVCELIDVDCHRGSTERLTSKGSFICSNVWRDPPRSPLHYPESSRSGSFPFSYGHDDTTASHFHVTFHAQLVRNTV
jgi:hypothetical protein